MKKISFAIPPGYEVPEGTESGQTFDESATFKLEGDNLCLVMVNGVSLPGYEEKGERAMPDDADGLGERYKAAMAGAGTTM